MRALVHDPAAPRGLRLAEVPGPVPTASQALVGIKAVSINFGEVAYLAERREPGEVPGWDAAGLPSKVELLGDLTAAVDRVEYVLLGSRD
ncbi:hypothetical protein [Amycolatopsis magusensis]|uniref:hypothetical protein n=1 Tax=Amycolatopsis magusensis TaxID=882444 RepID=UPI0024A8E064|nr:hypothetical protein [Amycolatopsis magusensis]MDI5974702.1 hypothetical protein [Amycolatopsis magusensis]